MPFKSARIDRLYVVRMEGAVERADVDRIVAGAAEAARKDGRPVIYVGINTKGMPTPSSDVRGYVVDRAGDLLKAASTLEVVMEGDGLGTSLLRTIVRGMITVGRARLGSSTPRSFIHATFLDAATRVAPQLRITPKEAESQARALGLLG